MRWLSLQYGPYGARWTVTLMGHQTARFPVRFTRVLATVYRPPTHDFLSQDHGLADDEVRAGLQSYEIGSGLQAIGREANRMRAGGESSVVE